MKLGLEDKPVLVMASGSGIGLGVALEFAREKAKVMLFDISEEKLKEAKDKIFAATQNQVEYTVGDMTRKQDIENVVQRTNDTFGSIYALFNNTGGPPAGKFEQFDDQAWVHAFELTLLGYVRSIRAVLPIMRKAGTGRIVNNASSSVKRVIDNLILSNAFRTGIMGMTKTLCREFGPENILINLIGPGKIATDRVKHLDSIKASSEGIPLEELQQRNAKTIPLGRYGSTEEIAKLVVFLCSEANTYITGQSILVDGGMVKAY
jgi:3-oxoacyl-[acyl-carrier protein] reductase